LNIIITNRSSDYHAAIEGRPEIWGNGTTPREAIGNLVQSHKEVFGITEIQSTIPAIEIYSTLVG